RRGGRDLDIGGDSAHLQLGRDGADLSNLQSQPILFPGLETRHLNFDRISGCGDSIYAEVAILSGYHAFGYTEAVIGDGHLCPRDYRPGGVVYDTFNSACELC